MKSEALSTELRTQSGRFLKHRRGIVGLALAAAGSMGLIALYQTGIVRQLPDLPFHPFNSSRVSGSGEAYSHLQTGDGFLGLISFAVTATLAAMGPRERALEKPWIPLALAAKAGSDVGGAAKLTYDEWAKHRAFCTLCLIAAGTTVATFALALPEAKAAIKQLQRRRRENRPRRILEQALA